jgi:hypothetical protein
MMNQTQLETPKVRYWQAGFHKWGPARVHLEDDENRGRTLCGKALRDMGGWEADSSEFNCQGCLQTIESRKRRAKKAQQSANKQGEET